MISKKGGGLLGERPDVLGGAYQAGPPNPMNAPPNYRQGPPEYRPGPFNNPNAPENRQVMPPNQYGAPSQYNGPVHQEHCNSSVVMVRNPGFKKRLRFLGRKRKNAAFPRKRNLKNRHF